MPRDAGGPPGGDAMAGQRSGTGCVLVLELGVGHALIFSCGTDGDVTPLACRPVTVAAPVRRACQRCRRLRVPRRWGRRCGRTGGGVRRRGWVRGVVWLC